eukprot:COSAG01_NODE_37541_length_502_cov_0.893300_1_plen_47_part_01
MLAEIYLCHACSCHEILRAYVATTGQELPDRGGQLDGSSDDADEHLR